MNTTITRHWFRRTARRMERDLEATFPTLDFKVERTRRGRSRWRVVRTR